MGNVGKNWWVVTGGTSGIGAAVVQRAVDDGYDVLAIGRRSLDDRHGVRYLSCDLASPDCGAQIRAGLLAAWDAADGPHQLTGLVHAAGISDRDWGKSFEVNVGAAYRLNEALAPLLKQSRGAIVHVGSPVATSVRLYGRDSHDDHEKLKDMLAHALKPMNATDWKETLGEGAAEGWEVRIDSLTVIARRYKPPFTHDRFLLLMPRQSGYVPVGVLLGHGIEMLVKSAGAPRVAHRIEPQPVEEILKLLRDR